MSRYLEEQLGLAVNKEKSRVAPSREVEFLGFQIHQNKKRIGTEAKKRFKDKVRELTRRNNGYSMYQIVQRLNKYLRGWVGYFRIQQFRTTFEKLDTFIRNRLRSMQLKKWKNPAKFQRMMIKAGLPVPEAQKTWIRIRRWRSIKSVPVKRVLNLKWFRDKGLLFLDDYTQRNLEPQFTR